MMLALIALLPASVMAAEEAKMTVKLDGKTLYIPEIRLTRKITPVTSLLYIGSWKSTAKTRGALNSLAKFDLKNNNLTFAFPDKLLEDSKPSVVKRGDLDTFLDEITWDNRQETQFAFKAISGRSQPAIIEMQPVSNVTVFVNGRPVVGRGYIPIMLAEGENIINIKQSSAGAPRIGLTVRLDHVYDFQAAWQSRKGFLERLVVGPKQRATVSWSPNLGAFSVSAEVRDVAADKIVIQKHTLRRGMALDDDAAPLAPGIYEVVYSGVASKVAGASSSQAREQDAPAPMLDGASELFIIGNPKDIFAKLSDSLLSYATTPGTKLAIEAQMRRARILLADNNYNVSSKLWQKKITEAFNSLATFEHMLKDGVTDVAKDQPGLRIGGFVSGIDGSAQFYRLFVPSTYKPGTPLPLLVVPSTKVGNTKRAFIESPVMADRRGSLLWAKSAEKHGFAILWPGYRGVPEGYTYESVHINEAIQAMEKDYTIDKQRISVYASCSAGYNSGRLVSEYENQFAAIVYDRAVFDMNLPSPTRPSPVLEEWLKAVNPVPRVIGNRNLKIFVMHDDTRPAGHGPMELTLKFLAQAQATRVDVVSYLSDQPMKESERLDMTFSWLAPCRNEHPSAERSRFLEHSGYQGPIMEIFATPTIIVEGTRAGANGKETMQKIAESVRSGYTKYFHGAECVIKKDDEVTADDIIDHSLVLIGNPQYNSVWGDLQSEIPLKVDILQASYKDVIFARNYMFEAIVRHPLAKGKYILMIGTGDVKNLQPIPTDLFNDCFDCRVFSTPPKVISKLDDLAQTREVTSSKWQVTRIPNSKLRTDRKP